MPLWTSEGTEKLQIQDIELDGPKTTPFERKFNPYDFNGGFVSDIYFVNPHFLRLRLLL